MVKRFNNRYEIKNPLHLFNNSQVSVMNSYANLKFGHSIISEHVDLVNKTKIPQGHSAVNFSRTLNPGEAKAIL
jgi:hypothetical protein